MTKLSPSAAYVRAALALAAGLVAAGPAWADPAAEPPLRSPGLQRAAFNALITREAERRAVPPALAAAVASIESGWDPNARGSSGEVGLMQIMPATAQMLGFQGTLEQLADPETNIRLGVRYLGTAWALSGGNPCVTLMKYRAGHGETVMSARSMVYCNRAQRYLAAVGSPLASAVSVYAGAYGLPEASAVAFRAPTTSLLTPDEWARLRAGRRTAEDSQRFWAARAIQLQALRTQQTNAVMARNTLTRPARLTAHGGPRRAYAWSRRARPSLVAAIRQMLDAKAAAERLP